MHLKNDNPTVITLALACVIIASLVILRIAIVFSYVPEITGIDNNFVYTVARILKGLTPYPNPEAFPYAGNIYSPLYFNICAFIGALFNVNPDNVIQVFYLCRATCLVFDLMTAFLLYKTLLSFKNISFIFALAGVAIFLCILCYLAYTFNRVDSLFLFLYAAVIYKLVQNKSFSFPQIGVLALLSSLCIFSKQNGIILPVLVCVWLFMNTHIKRLMQYLITFAIIFFTIYFFYKYVIGYQYLGRFAFNGIQNKIVPAWFYTYIFKPMASSYLLIPLAISVVICFNYFFKKGFLKEKIFSVIFVIQLFFSVGAALKWGSSLGYFNESFFLSFVLIGLYYNNHKADIVNGEWIFWPLVLLSVVFFVHIMLQDYLFFVNEQKQKKQAYINQQQVQQYLKGKVRGFHVFNMASPNRDFFKLFFIEEMAVPHFDTIDCCLLPDKTFDYTQLKQELLNGKIKYIITTKNNPVTSVWNISLNNYKMDTTINEYDLYKFSKVL